jgi:hypothetical protein
MATFRTVEFYPVIYTLGFGGGENEYEVENLPGKGRFIYFPVELSDGESIQLAWYTPYNRVFDLSGFSRIEVAITRDLIGLGVLAVEGARVRMQIKIHAIITGG